MKQRIFWLIFLLLSAVVDLTLPLLWAVVATLPILGISWWIAYGSEWF